MDITGIFAARSYAALRPATTPSPDFGSETTPLKRATADFAATLQEAESTAQAAMTGDADPHSLVMALAQTELAVETVVTVRDKIVEAYQEILRMPV